MTNNLLRIKLEQLKQQNHLGIMCHAVLGYPTLNQSIELVRGMIKAGADIIELQLPFSDPMADGPLIMGANERALKQNLTLQQCLSVIPALCSERTPIVVMSYFQLIYAYGVQKFITALLKSGVSGLIVPDLPPEEDATEGLALACRAANISFIPVLSPNVSKRRIKLNADRASDLLYCTARQGITGQKTIIDQQTHNFLERIKLNSSLARAVGFGIAKPSHIQALFGHAEIAVIGSAIIRDIEKDGLEAGLKLVRKLVSTGAP